MGDFKKRRKISRVLAQAKPTITFLSETKLSQCSNQLVRMLNGGKDRCWLEVPAIGASGGLLMMWDADQVDLMDPLLGAYTLSMRCNFLHDNFEGVVTGVYGPNRAKERRQFFHELQDIRGLWELPWLIGGDFNIIRKPEEKNTSCSNTRGMRNFN